MDKSLFDELYFGDYQPNDVNIVSKEYDAAVDKIIAIQKRLSHRLSPKDYKDVLALCNLHTMLNDFYGKQSYSDGIKFAVNFLYNALCDKISGEK